MTSIAQQPLSEHSVQAPALRGISHLLAALFVLIGVVPLLQRAHAGEQRWADAAYGAAVALALTISAAYNRARAKPRFAPALRRADRAGIFVLLAGTYTPFLAALDRTWAWAVLTAIWVVGIIGSLAMLLWKDMPRKLAVTLYLAFGWAFVACVPATWQQLGAAPAALLLIGGVSNTLGAIVYVLRRPNPSPRWFGYHEVFHLFVVVAVVAAFVATWDITG